jgi:hypothetical protein
VIVGYASNAEMRAIALTTSCQGFKAVQMMTGIFNYYAVNAIQAKGVGFLIAQGHP